MPDLANPVSAPAIAVFGAGANPSAGINYNLPLPGAYPFQRIVPIDIPADDFSAAALAAGIPLTALGVVQLSQNGGISQVDEGRLLAYYARIVPPGSRPSLRQAGTYGENVLNPNPQPDAPQPAAAADGVIVVPNDLQVQAARRNAYLQVTALQAAQEVQARIAAAGATPVTTIDVPVPGLGGSVRNASYDLRAAGVPHIAIVETWQLTSFLGDYGLGRTLQTFTLLPGEQTTITVETWRTDTDSSEDSSSIFDSSDIASQDRFTSALTRQSGAAAQDQTGWSTSLGFQTGGTFNFLGLVSANMSTNLGFALNQQVAQQDFSNSISTASQDHANQVNSNRSQAVSQNTSQTVTTGNSTATVRTLSNINLRRVLNFVFRELNQEYQTVTALRGVALAFYNGNPGSAEIVPVYQLRDFVTKWIVPDDQEAVARIILALICQCVDDQGNPETMLQVGERLGGVYTWEDAQLQADGTIDFNGSVLGVNTCWRVKPGPIGQEGQADQVTGVVTARDTVVLRTDNVIAEALLGQADALDPYASALQDIDLQARTAHVKKTTEALDIVNALPQAQQVAGYKDMLVEPPEIEVVPAAAAAH